MVSINLTAVLDESEAKGLRDGLRELVRCQNELRSLVPDLDQASQIDLENLLISDRPELVPRIKILLNTIQDVRQEAQKTAGKVSTRLQKPLCSALLPASEAFVERTEYENLLAQALLIT